MSLSNILLIPGVGQMSFRDALSILSPYSPRLAANYMDPAGSLYTDASRTTQVTAVGNRIRSFTNFVTGGPHGSASSDAKSPLFARRPATGRRNLFEYTQELDNAYWTRQEIGSITTAAIAPDGTATAELVIPNTTLSAVHRLTRTVTTVAGSHVLSVYAKKGSYDGLKLTIDSPSVSANFDLTNGVTSGGTITDVGNGWFRCSLAYTAGASSIARFWTFNTYANALATTAFSGDGTSGICLWGAQLETGSTATNYQRVVTSADITEAGVRDVYAALFDGSDDCLQVSGFDLSDTDKVCVIAGVRALASGGMIAEHTASFSANNGSMFLFFGSDRVNGFNSSSRGDASGATNQAAGIAQSSPISAHVTATHDIAGDLSRIWRNATEGTQGTVDKGAGNFANSTFNIGGRANAASLPYNGAISYLFILGTIPPDDVLTRIYRGLAPQIGVSV